MVNLNKKRLLTLDDLYDYYSNHSRSTHFSSKQKGSPVVVQVPGALTFNSNTNNTEGLLPVVLQSCHIGRNVNQTKIDEDVMLEALPSFSNRPILGYIHEVDGEPHFYKHNLHEDEDGNTVYDEVPVGIVPESCDAKLEFDDEKGKTYVVINGYIFEEYSKAAEILRREKECSVSVELSLREFSYNAKEHCLVIEDFYFSGVTILGKTPDGELVNPGMVGSNIKLADFSEGKNSLFSDKYEAHMIEMQRKLDEIISRFNINNLEKGGEPMNHFEELLLKYNVVEDDITFEHENMSDEELDAKFAELFGEPEVNNGEVDPEIDNMTIDNPEDGVQLVVEEQTVEIPENEVYTRTYELSHDDIRCALYHLLVPYEESDGVYYYISGVYDTYFVYETCCGNTVYGQAYIKSDETVSFEGERYELFKELLTASEKAELDAMRSNYEEISQKLKSYEEKELEAKKVALLNSDDYSAIKDNEEFIGLVDNHSEVTFEELQNLCDKILLDTVKKSNFNTTSINTTHSETTKKQFMNPATKTSKKSRYGNLFNK